jgi:hypothetical protein
MFDFFKRSANKQYASDKNGRPKRNNATGNAGLGALDPLPLPEVTEGNSEADWSAWEDSVAFQDSQLPDFGPSKPPPAPPAHPGDTVPDPFHSVHKHTP